jgi:transcriptional regulator with XRE-family HTH domain
MSRLGDNIRFLRKNKGFTQEELANELAKYTKMTRSILGSYEEGRAEPKFLTQLALSNYFGYSIKELMTEDLSVNSPTTPTEETKLQILAITVTPDNKELINAVPNKASAGYLNGFADQEYIKGLPCFALPLNEISQNRTYRIFQIKGDSMLPIVPDSYIITQYLENWRDIRDNDCYIVLTKDEGIVYKRVLNKISEKNEITLKSDNPAYEPYKVKLDSILELWKAIGYISFQLPNGQGQDLSLENLSNMVFELQKNLSDLKKNQG